MVSPPKLIVPMVGVSRKLIQRKKVLLPEPLRPRMEITSPLAAFSETPLMTSNEPKLLCRLSIFSTNECIVMIDQSDCSLCL